MQFNQTNKDVTNVNNAISEKGPVVQNTGSARTGDVVAAASEKGSVTQTSGEGNRVQVGPPKESFWSELRKKLGSAWKWLLSLFGAGA